MGGGGVCASSVCGAVVLLFGLENCSELFWYEVFVVIL